MAISSNSNSEKPSIYDYQIQALNSSEVIDFQQFRGKKMMLVNVASKCGFTYQYEGLEQMYQEYKDQLVIIGFPCNQFMMQEPGSEEKIAQFCSINYGVTFPLTEKVKVKGRDAHDIYKWLTKERLNGQQDIKVTWNFNKFIVDEEGQIIGHFGANVKPQDEEILELIA